MSPLVVAPLRTLPPKQSFAILEVRMLRCNATAGDAEETLKKRQILAWGVQGGNGHRKWRDQRSREGRLSAPLMAGSFLLLSS